jgi:hypothetical protein
MKVYLYRSNRIGMTPLNYKTPIQAREHLIANNMINYLSCK